MTPTRPWWLICAPVIFLMLWSGGYAVAKLGLQYTQPMTLLALRFGLVVLIMGLAFVILRPPVPKTRAEWGHLAIVGFLIQTVYFGLSYMAFNSGVAAGTVALLMSLQPVLVALIVPSWSGERVGRRQWLGLFLGLTGAAIVIVARSAVEAPTVLGFTCAALALLVGHHGRIALGETLWPEPSSRHGQSGRLWRWVVGHFAVDVVLGAANCALELGVCGSPELSGHRQFGDCGGAAFGHDPCGRCIARLDAVFSGAAAGCVDRLVHAGRSDAASGLGWHGRGCLWGVPGHAQSKTGRGVNPGPCN